MENFGKNYRGFYTVSPCSSAAETASSPPPDLNRYRPAPEREAPPDIRNPPNRRPCSNATGRKWTRPDEKTAARVAADCATRQSPGRSSTLWLPRSDGPGCRAGVWRESPGTCCSNRRRSPRAAPGWTGFRPRRCATAGWTSRTLHTTARWWSDKSSVS